MASCSTSLSCPRPHKLREKTRQISFSSSSVLGTPGLQAHDSESNSVHESAGTVCVTRASLCTLSRTSMTWRKSAVTTTMTKANCSPSTKYASPPGRSKTTPDDISVP
eukprot:3594825-Rhodomonas_salina.1